MNELTFIIHIIALVGFVFIARRFGKEALAACLAVQVILANLFVMKQTTLFGLNVTCSDVYTVGSIFAMNLIQLHFGKKMANKALNITFFLLFLVMVMSQFHLRYLPSKDDTMSPAFTAILGSAPRIMITSFVSAFLAQKLDIKLFGFIKNRFPKTSFFLPFALASLITQFFDTVLFSYGALYGTIHNMRDIIVMSYTVKVLVIFGIAPFTLFVKKQVQHDPI